MGRERREMSSDGGECKWNAQCRVVAERDPDLRRDGSLDCSEEWFELHLETLGTLQIFKK